MCSESVVRQSVRYRKAICRAFRQLPFNNIVQLVRYEFAVIQLSGPLFPGAALLTERGADGGIKVSSRVCPPYRFGYGLQRGPESRPLPGTAPLTSV